MTSGVRIVRWMTTLKISVPHYYSIWLWEHLTLWAKEMGSGVKYADIGVIGLRISIS